MKCDIWSISLLDIAQEQAIKNAEISGLFITVELQQPS
jgi:hypothetical protein